MKHATALSMAEMFGSRKVSVALSNSISENGVSETRRANSGYRLASLMQSHIDVSIVSLSLTASLMPSGSCSNRTDPPPKYGSR